MKKLFTKIWEILTSKRFKSFYWRAGTMATAGFLDVVLQTLVEWNPDNLITILAGLIFAEITKKLNKNG